MEKMLSLSRIRQHYDSLGAAERRVADFVLEDWKRVIDMPVADISKASGASQATIVRFCRSIGFKGLAEFKLSLSSGRLSPDANVFAMSGDEPDAVVARMISNFNKGAIDDATAILDMDRMSRAADALDRTRQDRSSQVLILAEGGSGCSARCAFEVFTHIGVPCFMVEDAMYQILLVSKLRQGDVVLAISHSGSDRDTVECVQEARKLGATTLSMIGLNGTPLSKHSDIVLNTGLYGHEFFSETITARICELNVICALHAMVSLRRQRQLSDHRQTVSDIFRKKRIKI